MADPDPTTLELDHRLMLAVQDWLATPCTDDALEAARQLLTGGTVQRRRDQDGPITPDSDPDKKPRLIVTAQDTGRTVKGGPFRNLTLALIVRANHKLPGGMEADWVQLCGAVETLLDGLNLTESLTSPTRGIHVFVATRRDAAGITVNEAGIRMKRYPVEIKAAGLEHTV